LSGIEFLGSEVQRFRREKMNIEHRMKSEKGNERRVGAME